VGIFEGFIQPYTAKGEKHSELYWIDRHEIHHLLSSYPHIREEMMEAVQHGIQEILSTK